MARSSRLNFVRQQGFRKAPASTCELSYPVLMFQPRVVGLLFLAGVLLQEWWLFLGLGAVLWWCGLFPRLNPFEALYNGLVASRRDSARLTPAPAPRRFAQGLAGTLMVLVALALAAGSTALAWALQAFLALALAALVFGSFCLGSYLFHLIRGDRAFARRTLPWAGGG